MRRYVIVGIWNTVFGISIFFVISNLFSTLPNFPVLFLSYVISIIQSHFSQRYFVWVSKKMYIAELTKFASGYLMQFLINLIVLEIAENVFSLHRNSCQLFLTPVFVVFSFFVNKRYVFSKNSK
jgi:putative flippase GtrA